MQSRSAVISWLYAVVLVSTPMLAEAGAQWNYDASISTVAVNGGADTANAGTTCILVATPVSSLCTNGWVAIPNNNKSLISAALAAKVSLSKVTLYYDDAGGFHCPGNAYTACSIINIQIQ